MAVALIADAHLGGPGGDGEELLRQLRQLGRREDCSRVVFMGDLFHVWVADSRFETSEVALILPAIRELRRLGKYVSYVEGNRDFFLVDSIYEDAFDEVGTEVRFEVDGHRYLAVHGDGLNDRDRRYLFWRWLSKSGPARLLCRLLPAGLTRSFMYGTESRLSKTNFKHKNQVPREAICGYAERRVAEGHDTVLLGHFHEPHTWSVRGGEVRILDAWFRSRALDWLVEESDSGRAAPSPARSSGASS